MGNQSKLGVTLNVPDHVEPLGVYEAADGIEVFETDTPYLLSDGRSLARPLPIKVVLEKTFIDSLGNLQKALGVKGLTPPPPAGVTWDSGQTWDGVTFWSDT